MSTLLAAALAASALADPRTLYVDVARATGANDGTSWINAFRGRTGLHAALAAAQPGDHIWIADGTYAAALANGSRTATFTLVSGVSLYAGFTGSETSLDQRDPAAHPAVFNGDLNSNGNAWPNYGDNTYIVFTGVNLSAGTVIDGLTITNSYNDASPGAFERYGGGMVISGGAPTIRNCTFRRNSSDWYGGGLALMNTAAVVEDCTFDGNHARSGHNIAHVDSSQAIIRRCRFIGDCAVTGGSAGVGVLTGRPTLQSGRTDTSHATIEDCFFSIAENEFSCPAGMGVYISRGSADILDCDFIRNVSCGGGGGVAGDGDVFIDRCRFIGNEGSADGGAAIHSFEGRYTVANSLFLANDREGFSTISFGGVLRIANCTFAFNGSTTGLGGGSHFVIMPMGVGDVTLDNCILWGNISRQGERLAVARASAPFPRFNNSLVQAWNGSLPGAGSFAANPMFIDILGPNNTQGDGDEDLRLAAGSPALDRSNSAPLLAMAADRDLLGLPRFVDDPAAPNAGPGPAPHADLGCFETQRPCAADFNNDGFLDFFDYDAFVLAFEVGDSAADFNGDGFLDFFDYDAFVTTFEAGC